MRRIMRFLGLPALLVAALAAADTSVPTIAGDALAARQAAKDPALVVLDVRTPEEYAAGHVPGAINVPHDQVAVRLDELAPLKDKDVVVYCKAGKRAGMALETLGKAGYTRLQHLDGDMQAWSAAGRPVEKSAAPAEATPAPKP